MEHSNPFDRAEGRFLILKNRRQQYSLWPEHCLLPPGWEVICGPASQQSCYDWLEINWRRLTPADFAAEASEQNLAVR